MKLRIVSQLVVASLLIGCGGSNDKTTGGNVATPVTPPNVTIPVTPPPPLPDHPAYTQTPLDLNYSTALFHIDFESLPDGELDPSELCRLRLYHYCMAPEDQYEGHPLREGYTTYSTVEFLGSKALKIEVDPAKLSTKHVIKLLQHIGSLGADYQELYASYRIYYPEDFDTGLGFKGLGGLVGIANGEPYPTGCNKINGDNGFSVRQMNKAAMHVRDISTSSYVYHPHHAGTCGQHIYYDQFWSYRKGLEQGYLVETRVKMNTPGKRDGEIEVTINGARVQSLNNLEFSRLGGYGINHYDFHSFYGGDYLWNPTRKTYIIIDDLAVTLKSVHEK